MALGNLGVIYNNMGDKAKAKECTQCAINILSDVLGDKDPDTNHFRKSLAQMEEDS